jgi:hypothetical protein
VDPFPLYEELKQIDARINQIREQITQAEPKLARKLELASERLWEVYSELFARL